MAQLILLPGKERSSFKRHPWLFAGSVGRLEGRAQIEQSIRLLQLVVFDQVGAMLVDQGIEGQTVTPAVT